MNRAMPRDGAIIFSDLIGKLCRVACDKCGHVGRYPLRRLISLPSEGFLQMTGALEKIRQQVRRFFITLASIAIFTIVAFIILIAHEARAQPDVGGALTDNSDPGLGRPNSLRLQKPLIDPSGNIVRRNIEIVDTPILRPGPRIKASLLRPASMKSRLILIDIDVMQVFIPWEFRVTGAFERVVVMPR